MDDQEEFELDFMMSIAKAEREGRPIISQDSIEKLKALLKEKSEASSKNEQSSMLGPIERAMRDHPGLTREEAEEMAEEFGF